MTRIIYDTSEETKIRERARLREKALHDEASAIKDATNKGFAKGREEGREEGIAIGEERQRNAMIEKMRAMGMTEEQITNITS